MWIHPDLVEDQQWTSATKKKSKGKGKASSCNVITPCPREEDGATASLTDTDNERSVLAAEQEIQPNSGTRSGKKYLKKYDQAAGGSAENPEEVEEQLEKEQPPKQPTDKKKPKELRYNTVLQKDRAEKSKTPFQFNVLAQLANIPARLTIYELLRLSKPTREALREALADSETFLAHAPTVPEGGDGDNFLHSLQVSLNFPCITFTPEDMQIK